MKTIRTLLAAVAIILFSGLAFVACEGIEEPMIVKPEDSQELKNDAIQNSKADNAMGGALGAISTYGISEDWTKKFSSGEPVVTFDNVDFIVTLTYPNNGGTIIIDWNKYPRWTTEDLTGVVTIANFLEDGVSISGILNIASVGTNIEPALSVNGDIVMNIDSQNVSYSINRTFVWHAGFSNQSDLSDDAFATYGTSTVTAGNKTLKTTILDNQKLIKYNTCDYPQQGIIKMEVIGQNKSVTIDYGVDKDGNASNECDKWAKFTIKVGNASLTMIIEL